MMVTARRLRSIGWMATLVVCVALVMVLAFRVNALRSQVHLSQARIIALKQETMYLETEFETRANQQQLKTWNDVEFGYAAPIASQYLDNERQLASYAKPVEPDAPAPIRVASADDAMVAAAAFPAMVSPLTGQPMTGKPVIGQAVTGQAVTGQAVTGQAVTGQPPSPQPTTEARAGVNHAAAAPHASDDDAPRLTHEAVPAAGLTGLGERLGTVRHGAGTVAKAKPARALAAKTPPGQKSRSARAVGEKSPSRAFAGHVVQPRDHLASADPHHHALPSAKSGTPLIKLALRDAKAIK